jgi:hypothetical protein
VPGGLSGTEDRRPRTGKGATKWRAYGLVTSDGRPLNRLPAGYGGAFNWTLPDDAPNGYPITRSIAAAVGYPPNPGS